ncbi:expressed unknown protein [Seminavis robusta]|uniref:Uncharacterized protein n=1 Tax=Seminavis robusta TaxID=568900 RepID=A0A9N8DJP8_9STRA|nr:expressed unknown protein [Seminavis robusta]|eukprot:Sro178_g078280.1 n/a (493) ;mRNA; r:83924-85402
MVKPISDDNNNTSNNAPIIGSNTIVDFDDGHIPENFAATAQGTKLVRYSSFVDDRIPRVHVIDEAVPSALADAIYNVTVMEPQNKPWGTYVTREQLDDYRTQYITTSTTTCTTTDGNENTAAAPPIVDPQNRQSLAVAAAAHFFHHALQQQQSSSSGVQTFTSPKETTTTTPIWTHADHTSVLHGVAIWALASTEGAHVPYHLDYAEQIRYEQNIIVPPFLAGTLQCTKNASMKGGDLGVCFGGLEHYAQHGYKGAKQQQEDNPLAANNDDNWITVPYRYQRMIIKSGHLPHHSTRVEQLEPATQKRVIVGFNAFGHDYGPLVQQAPEHSHVFRRKVALQRALLLSTSNNNNNSGKISMQALQANKGLSKLLVLAKRAKIKHELAQAQEQLDDELDDYLVKHGTTSVETIMQQFGKKGGWPSPVDVQVHINQRLTLMTRDDDGNQENRGQQKRRPLCLRKESCVGRDNGDQKTSPKSRMVSPMDIVFLAPER